MLADNCDCNGKASFLVIAEEEWRLMTQDVQGDIKTLQCSDCGRTVQKVTLSIV
jgi:hypothetical protein